MAIPPDDALALARVSPLIHFESCVKIEDKLKRPIRPKANVFQRRLFEAYETLLPFALALGLQIRILGLKIRQCGGTTASVQIVYHHCQRFVADAVVMANVAPNSAEMLRKIKYASQSDTFPWGNKLDPTREKLEWQNGSRAELTSAETNKVGISRTRQLGLFSEACKYPRGGVKDDKAIMASMLPSLSGEGTIGIAESTPEGACYDPETEVLTDQGWKFFADLNGSEGIMTRPQAGGPVYYQTQWVKQVHHHEGDMISIKNRGGIDLLVTPNHSVWCSNIHGKMKMKVAGQLAMKADYFFERAIEWEQPDLESFTLPAVTFGKGNGFQTYPARQIPLTVWLPFLGHWLSDGGVMCRYRKDRPKLRRNTVYTTQTKFVELFRNAIMALEPYIQGRVKEVNHVRGKRWIIEDTQLARYLHDYSQPKRIPRDLLMGMSKRQCQQLLNAIYEGDGDNDRRNGKRRFDCGKVYVGIDKPLQDDVMELCLKAGYATSASGPPRNMIVGFRQINKTRIRATSAPERIPGYNGNVYCVSLPKDHLLMVRRGGKAVWCGNSGWFYEQWHGNKDQDGALTLDEFIAELVKGNRNPGNGWVKVFAAWWEFEDNKTEVRPEQAAEIMSHLTPREANGIDKYGWTVEQIAWRRATLKSECGGSETLYDEYYPEDEITCFTSSGRPRFDMPALIQEENRSKTTVWEEGTLDLQTNGTVVWSGNASGWAPFKMCERPKEGCKYLVSVDPMTGEDQTESNAPDRHSILVHRAEYHDGNAFHPESIVARVKAPYFGEADQVGQYVEALSKYFGDCIVVLEINMGLHILQHLQARGVNVFQREVIDPYNRDTPRKMYGFKTKDQDTRRMLIDSLAIAIRDGTIHINDQHILDECKTFVMSKNGKAEARPGRKDDDVLAMSMGHYCIGAATTYLPAVRRRKKPADWRNWKGWS